MIQRIQTIYLVLAGLFPAFTFFFPLHHFTGADFDVTMYGCHFSGIEMMDLAPSDPYVLAFIGVLAIVLPIVAIFQFKNRKRQILWVNLSLYTDLLWYIVAILYANNATNSLHCNPSFAAGFFAPALAIIALFLAKRGIKRDEALVRAADRIR